MDHPTHVVTVLGQPVNRHALDTLTRALTAAHAHVTSTRCIAHYPLTGHQLHITAADTHADAATRLRAALAHTAADEQLDIAIEPVGRIKKMVMFDVDSTLIQGEVIEMLAAKAGTETEVQAVTDAAMRGKIDFTQALQERVATLAGLDATALAEVTATIQLTPGARTTIRTLRRLGYHCGVVSGGFSQVIDPLLRNLGFGYIRANTLEIVDGRLTGRVIGEIVDRPAKAAALREFADTVKVPIAQTVAVGDGANDIDMLTTAGLGIAFNAKPILRAVADATLSFPYLDTVLFIMGITSADVETSDFSPG